MFRAWDPFLESHDNERTRKAVVASSKIMVSVVLHLTRCGLYVSATQTYKYTLAKWLDVKVSLCL